jgi:hypothetical protein
MLHGNVAVDKLQFNQVFFNGRIPIFDEYRSMWERSIGVEVRAVGLDQLSSEIIVVKEFVEYLLTCLEPKTRKQVEIIASKRYLGLKDKQCTIGILFPDHLVDFFPSSKKQASESGSDA